MTNNVIVGHYMNMKFNENYKDKNKELYKFVETTCIAIMYTAKR